MSKHRENFTVTLKEGHKDKKVYKITAADKLEAFEWGERNAEAVGIKGTIEVIRDPKE